MSLMRCGYDYVTNFLKISDPLLSLKRVKIDTSSLACKWNVTNILAKERHIALKGAGSYDPLFKIWYP